MSLKARRSGSTSGRAFDGRARVALVLFLLLSACLSLPRDLQQESLHLPPYKNYFAADESVVHIRMFPGSWGPNSSAYQKRARLYVTLDGKAVRPVLDWISVAPVPREWVWQVQVPRMSPEERTLYIGPVAQTFEPRPTQIYGFVVIFDGREALAGFVTLGTLGGGARGLSVEEVHAVVSPDGRRIGGPLAKEIADWTAAIAARWNRRAGGRER